MGTGVQARLRHGRHWSEAHGSSDSSRGWWVYAAGLRDLAAEGEREGAGTLRLVVGYGMDVESQFFKSWVS